MAYVLTLLCQGPLENDKEFFRISFLLILIAKFLKIVQSVLDQVHESAIFPDPAPSLF